MRKNILFLILVVCLPFSSLAADTSVNVPLDHWVYRFLDRFEAKGILPTLRNNTRPLSRLEVARALVDITRNRFHLSLVETGELDELTHEFTRELSSLGITRPADPPVTWLGRLYRGDHPLTWSDTTGSSLTFDPLFRSRSIFFPSIDERIYQSSYGLIAWGSLKGSLGFRLRFRDTREQGTRTYRDRSSVFERRIEYVEPKGHIADYREATAVVIFNLPWFRVEVGKDFLSWGPGFRSNLVLSDNAPSFDMVRMSATYGRVRLTAFSGILRSLLPDSVRSYLTDGGPRILDRRKYISAHRAEITIRPGLDLGFHEVVIYGDRGPELIYMNPVMFYWAAQSYLGNKDNLMMGADIDFRPGGGIKLYAALLLDDLKKFKLFSHAYTNKLGFQIGSLWTSPFDLQDTDLRLEYVRLEPWVYTHDIPINSYFHFDSILGDPLGPNADGLYTWFEHRPTKDITLILSAGHERHGRNPRLPDGTILNIGGDPFLGLRLGDNYVTKKFLDGDRETKTTFGFEGSYEFIRNGYLAGSYKRIIARGIPGERSRNQLDLSVRYNYY